MACVFYTPQLMVGTVQFDGVDVHYSSQRYFADAIHAGHLPFWTPYLFAGFPFLADLQVAAWYPLNWPFFVVGIGPHSMSGELLLHGLIACGGAYALAIRQLGGNRPAAVATAIFYGLSGYFAAHAQHVGMVQTAAWLPWLVLLLDLLGERLSVRRLALASLLGAALALPGHFQVALYAFSGAAAWAMLDACIRRAPAIARRRAVGLLTLAGGGALLSAVMILPAMELVGQSLRSQLDVSAVDIGYFHPGALITLVQPDYYGLLSGTYHGPGDSTQHYFYAGVLLVPLVLVGLRQAGVRRMAVLLGLPFLWYALGPMGGLFRLVVLLPGFRSVELPMHGWFLPGLGLALLGGAGFGVLEARLKRHWLATLLLIVMFGDVFWFNEVQNPLAYARGSFDALYGAPLRAFSAQVLAARPPVERLYGQPLAAVGYRNHPLQSFVETTYGYNPLELAAYADYAEAAEANPRLVDGLAATHRLSLSPGGEVTLQANVSALPLAFFARRLISVPDAASARAALVELDPVEQTLVIGPLPDGVDAGTPATASNSLSKRMDMESSTAVQRPLQAVSPDPPAAVQRPPVAASPDPPAAVQRPLDAVSPDPSAMVQQPLQAVSADPSAMVQRPLQAVSADPSAMVTVRERGEGWLTLEYRAAAAGVVRVAIAAYPGWHATLNGVELRMLTVDRALLGVVVPAGEGQLRLWYAPNYFWLGAVISALTLAVTLAALVLTGRRATAMVFPQNPAA